MHPTLRTINYFTLHLVWGFHFSKSLIMSDQVMDQEKAVQLRCSSVPAPTFDDLDPIIAQALTRSYNTNLRVNQTLTQQFFSSGMREVANQMAKFQELIMKTTAEAMAANTRQITNAIDQKMSNAQQIMENRFSDLEQKMESQLSNRHMETYSRKKVLRSCIAWMLRLGPDTVRNYGMTPIFRFVEHQGQHLTVFDRLSFGTWSYLHRKKFKPIMTRTFVKTLGRDVEDYLYNAASEEQLREWQALFPFQFTLRSKVQDALYVFKTEQVVKFLVWERALEQDGKALLFSCSEGQFETYLYPSKTSGRLRCRGFGPEDNGKFDSPNLTKIQANKCLSAKTHVKNLWSYDIVGVKTRSLFMGNREAHDAWMAQRVYFGLPDSSEYLSSPVFYQGVSMIRNMVYELKTPPYVPDRPFHIVHWDDPEFCDQTVYPLWQLLPGKNCLLRRQLQPVEPAPLLSNHVETCSDDSSDDDSRVSSDRARRSKRRAKKSRQAQAAAKRPRSTASQAGESSTSGKAKCDVIYDANVTYCVTCVCGADNVEHKEVGGKYPRKTCSMLNAIANQEVSPPSTPDGKVSTLSGMDIVVPEDNDLLPNNAYMDIGLPQAMSPIHKPATPGGNPVSEQQMLAHFPVGPQEDIQEQISF